MKKAKRKPAFSVFLFTIMLLLLVYAAYNFASLKRLYDDILEENHMLRLSSYKGDNPSLSESASDELLILVNPWNPIPDDYEPTLYTLSDGTQVDERCVRELLDMMDACREAGGSPYICSAYRTEEYQRGLFENKVGRLMAEGLSYSDAEAEAARVVAYPGTSEHQLGLAADIIDSYYTALDEGQEDTETQRWLMDNSWKYGFILRYPNGKSDITGIIYEPWHYRYVGKDTAKAVYDSGLCFEEFLKE